MSDDLVTWYLAHLDLDGVDARLAVDEDANWFPPGEFTVTYEWARHTHHFGGGRGSAFVPGAPSPAAVLADIAAKRAIVELHHSANRSCATCHGEPFMEVEWDAEAVVAKVGWTSEPTAYPCPTLRLLASVYADRPGYDERWRP